MNDLRAKITEVLSAHEYAGKPGGPDCGGVCDCPELCTCGAEVRAWRQHVADAVMGLVETAQQNVRADHLMDLAGWDPSDGEAERTQLAARVRELEAERGRLQRKLDAVEGKRSGTWDTWAEHIARKQTEPADPPPKPSLTLEEARQQAAKHARALEGGQ